MREKKRAYSIKRKKQMRTTTFSMALLVAAILVISSSLSVMSIKNESTQMNINDTSETIMKGDPAGLDPQLRQKMNPAFSTEISSNPQPLPIAEYMYGYVAYAGTSQEPLGPCYYPLDNPQDITSLKPTGSGNFIAGGTWTCDYRWLGCEYGSGVLWEIDPETGDMWAIGGGGTNCNGLAWDPVYNRLYGTTGTSLVEYDPDTGEQTVIGSHNQAGKTMIAMDINLEGVCYIYDVLFQGSSTLFTVDLDTGEATEVASMGEPLVYAQDCAFDRSDGILYLAAYYSYGFLATIDLETAEITPIDNFEGNAEITGSMIMEECIPPEHDVGIKSIDKPEASGYAVPEMEMAVTVKNYGNNTETFNAQMEIIKCESSGEFLLEEYFEGATFPPEGWETDYWAKSYTNYASGESPEARVYKYTQYYQGDYYDNYIQTKPFDCTGWEKINLKFRFAADLYYPQYTSFFVKYRRNETSPWKDVSPWANPLNQNYEGDFYEIGCYGFGQSLGENFSIRFEYIGYYYYFNYFYIDDVTVEGCGGCAEYAELVEDLTLDAGQEMQVTFPGWQPSEWQNESYQDTWEEYPIHAFTIMEGDQNPRNNDKWMLLELYYPYLHDIEVTRIDSPSEERSIPGQVFPVRATMTNVGQYPDCCISFDIAIGETTILDTLLYEDAWPNNYPAVPANGWTDEHKNIVYYYGWRKYYTSYSGGSSPEAMLYYYYARADYVFYSYAFDTSEYQNLKLKFLSYINHFSGSGLYSLEAGWSHDAETWYAAWVEKPSSSGGYEVEVPITGGSPTTYIGFWVKGNPYYFNYWYIDNVEVQAVGLVEEYSDMMCQGPDLQPGESMTFEFEDWEPDFLKYEKTGSKEYIAKAWIEVEVDQDLGNNVATNEFTCDYWHDVGIEAVTSPNDGAGRAELLWDNGEPDGRNGLAGSMYAGYSNILIDDFQNEEKWTAQDGHFRFVWNSGYGAGNIEKVKIYFFEETGDCDPSLDEYAVREATVIDEWATGNYYFSRPEIACNVEFDDVSLEDGKWWVGFQPDGEIDNIAYLLTAQGSGCEIMADLPYWGYPRWSSSTYLWGTAYDLAWQLTGTPGGAPGIKTYVQPGNQAIEARVQNYGTFPELDLTCYAQIWEYITDPENGTQLYSDQVDNIDLDVPLGGYKDLAFEDFNFANEGRYGLFLDMPDDNDDFPKNNRMSWGIGVDSTDPVSSHALDPAVPDGLNGWYKSDIEITLTAYDPLSKDVSSDVKEIRYTINGGQEQIINGDEGTFTLHDDGEDITIQYWAIDNVGNDEVKNTIEPLIDMDQTPPEIIITYEIIGGSPLQGWDFVFTAEATDAMSGMERVEFALNDVLQETVTGPGPIYEWGFTYHGGLKITIKATAFDFCGLNAYAEVEPVVKSLIKNKQNNQDQTQSTSTTMTLPLAR